MTSRIPTDMIKDRSSGTKLSDTLNGINTQLADIAHSIKSTGTGDDTQAIQNAINNGGNHFHFPDPLYVVSGSITFNALNNLLITGNPNTVIQVKVGTVLPTAGLTIFIFSNCSNIIVKNLTFDGNLSNVSFSAGYQQEYGIRAVEASNILIEDCTFQNFQGDGIQLGSSFNWDASATPIKNTVVRRCLFTNIYRNCISPILVDDLLIEKITTTGTNNVASIDLETHDARDTIKNVTIRKCNLGYGIQILRNYFASDGSDKTNHHNILIEDCNLNGNNITSYTSTRVKVARCTNVGNISFDVGSGIGSHLYEDLEIVDNEVNYIYVNKYDKVNIDNNKTKNNNLANTILLSNSNYSNIENNKLIDVGNGSGSVGIQCSYDVGVTQIKNNKIINMNTRNLETGLKFVAYSSNKCIVSENYFSKMGTVANPSQAPTLATSPTGGSVGSASYGATYYVKYTWVNSLGETMTSPSASILTATGTTNTITVTLPTFPAGVTSANIYISITSGSEKKQGSTTSTTYTQTAAINESAAAVPSANTSGNDIKEDANQTGYHHIYNNVSDGAFATDTVF